MKIPAITFSPSESVAEIAIIGLCVFSIANPLVAQVSCFFFPYKIAGMNVMQWFQGLCLPLMLVTLPKLPRGDIEFSRPFSRLFWVYAISLALLHLRLLSANRIPGDMVGVENMVYFKIVFALLLLYYASRLVQSYESAERLLQSVLLGALFTAGWILICYFTGIGGTNYAVQSVQATAGSEGISGKAIAGFLVPAAGGAMFLTLRDDSYRWAVYASLLVAAVFMTFDRSSQVALGVGSSWMAIWWLALAQPRPRSKVVLVFLCIILVSGGIYYAHKGSEELLARWTHDFDRGEVGSGRGTFYTTAWDWFWNESSMMDFFFGIGFGNIFDLMHSRSGIFRHTHSDLFDMLLIGGVLGLALYLLFFYTIASQGRGLPVGSTEFGILVTLLVSFGTMSLLTGLMEFPHTMYAFGAECICIRALVIHEKLDPVTLPSIRPRNFTQIDLRNRGSGSTGELISEF
jgi:hypothetical protein